MTVDSPHAGRVVVVTGGGAGIGAAIATELGRQGAHVVTVDPLVSVDGTEQLAPVDDDSTAGRIAAAGGSARASAISVTDGDAVADLFGALVAEHGRLDAVVNVAGITRPTGFAKGAEADWAAALSVHLGGYQNVLAAALPIMAAAGSGQVLGVTSGSGWRAADAGAYSCAKRAVAALTWQLGRAGPPGVGVNAISPIAMTRMVTEALARAGTARGVAPTGSKSGSTAGSATGGLSLGSMPAPEQLGPLGAHLVGPDASARRGQILFAGGSEVARVDPPRLLEVVRTGSVASVGHVLDATFEALLAAEAAQATSGGSNARFGRIFDESAAAPGAGGPGSRVAVVTDRPGVGAELVAALEAAGATATATVVAVGDVGRGFDSARGALDHAATDSPLDAVVVALATPRPTAAPIIDGWEAILAEHDGLADLLLDDAGWARAAADHAAAADLPLRLVTLVDAATAGGRSRAQAAAQLARASLRATEDRVAAFAVGVEDAAEVATAAILAALLATRPDAVGLAGAELAVGAGWMGLRSHPRPTASVVFGGPELPPWFDAVLEEGS